MPVKVFSGSGCIEAHKSELEKLGSSCLIVTGKSAAKKCGALDDVTGMLDSLGITWSIYDGAEQNPTLVSCMQAGERARAVGAEFILGIGGGSAMDAAKATAVFAANDGMNEEQFYSFDWPEEPLPIALVGTTAGTGSEVTNVAVLTDSKARKHSIHDARMYAAVAFGDAKYTMTLPQSFTLSTGIDVFAHCTESYFSKKSNEISRAFALRGISLLIPALRAAAEGDKLSYEQREQLYEASILGGLAISVTGTCFPHNVGYYLTETYHVPHGTACAVFLPDMLTHVKACAPDYTQKYYDGIGADENIVRALIAKCLPELAIHMTAQEIDAALPRWENNGSVKNTVGAVTAEDIRKILINKFM